MRKMHIRFAVFVNVIYIAIFHTAKYHDEHHSNY